MGAVGRNIIVANTVGSFALLAVLVMGGFILSRGKVLVQFITKDAYCLFISMYCDIKSSQKICYFVSVDVKSWWLWGYWISPLMYGQNAITVNEFLGKSWSHVSKINALLFP